MVKIHSKKKEKNIHKIFFNMQMCLKVGTSKYLPSYYFVKTWEYLHFVLAKYNNKASSAGQYYKPVYTKAEHKKKKKRNN